jgi:hypothetical protein
MIDIEHRLRLVQHFAYRGNSHRHKGAAILISYMVWLYRWSIPVGRKGVFYLLIRILPALAASRARGGGAVPCGLVGGLEEFNWMPYIVRGFRLFY